MVAPRVSVVTPTFNRRERLARVLDALNAQTVSGDTFEVVVVDDGSSDGTSDWLSHQSYRFQLRPIRQQNGGPAKARNAGIQSARGELVLFLDDDVVPLPELLAEHLRFHDAESVPLVVMGPLGSLPHYAQPWVAWEQAKVEQQYQAMLRGEFSPTYRQFWTGNASLGREHLLAAGMFDATFLRGEDVELGIRLHQRGLEFRFNPDARGLHYAERSLESWMNAHRSYGRLEVDIFSQLGDDNLIETLAANYARLHPATRWLLGRTLEHPLRAAVTERLLQTYLRSPAASRAGRASDRLCSVFANLLYWRASRDALGTERFSEVMRRAQTTTPSA